MNDVNRCLVATSLLGNSGYQTDRKLCDQSKIALACDPRAIPARQYYKLAFARKKLNNEMNYSENMHCLFLLRNIIGFLKPKYFFFLKV